MFLRPAYWQASQSGSSREQACGTGAGWEILFVSEDTAFSAFRNSDLEEIRNLRTQLDRNAGNPDALEQILGDVRVDLELP